MGREISPFTIMEKGDLKKIDWGEVKGVVIATPFYEVKGYSPYIRSLVYTINALNMFGIPYHYYELSGDSYVDRAKNSLIHNFLKDEKFSHIFMIDSDESWDVIGFMRIIKAAKYGAEVVGAAYPTKNNWEFYGCIPKLEDGEYVGKKFDVPGGMTLLDMIGIPGGFICYSRKAFERTEPNLEYYNTPQEGKVLECFRCNIEEGGGRIGEDIYFQQRFIEMGGTVWLEPDVTIQHWGVKCWEGNYLNFIKEESKKNEEERKLGMSEDDTKEMLEDLCE